MLLTLIAGIGVGAIIAALVRNNYEYKKLVFETKLSKYSNLIEALQNVVAAQNKRSEQAVVSAQKQVELIGSDETIALSSKIYTSGNRAFPGIRDEMVKAMRKDLKSRKIAS